MSLRPLSEQLAELRHDAQLLTERAGDQEGQLQTLVEDIERERQQAQALSQAADELDVDEIRELIAAHLQRSAADAAAARRLLTSAHQQHAAARQLLEHLDNSEPGTGPWSPNAVLVVDDYGDVRDALARVLRNAGFVVRTATNGLEALIAAHEMRPGVIVMDVTMPVLDGIEATRLIKAAEATRDARVIAYTGNPMFDDSPARTLFSAVLTKPSTPGAVLAAVQQVARL